MYYPVKNELCILYALFTICPVCVGWFFAFMFYLMIIHICIILSMYLKQILFKDVIPLSDLNHCFRFFQQERFERFNAYMH